MELLRRCAESEDSKVASELDEEALLKRGTLT